MKEYRCKKTCYWGPQPGSESMYQRGDIIFATGSERQLDEFFEHVAIDPPGDTKEEKVANRRKLDAAGAE